MTDHQPAPEAVELPIPAVAAGEFGLNPPLWTESQVREAMSAALDRQAQAVRPFNENSPEFKALVKTIRAAADANAVPAKMWLAPMEADEAMWTEGRDPIMYRDLGDYRPVSVEVPAWQREPDGEVNHDKSKGTAAVRVWRAMRDSWLTRFPQNKGSNDASE